MRTWIFKNYLEDKHGKFIPMQTIESEEFGRHFFIDIGFHFISAPSFKDGGYDESQLDYVSDWSDWEDVDFGGDATFEIATNKLFFNNKCFHNKCSMSCSMFSVSSLSNNLIESSAFDTS